MVSWRRPAAGGGVEVVTGTGSYTAGQLVVTPGPWAPQLLAELGIPFSIERQVQYWFQPTGGVDPFRPERHPIYIWEDAAGIQVYGFPAIDGPDGGAKIAFFRRGGTPTTPETIDRAVHDDEIAAMAAAAGSHLPDLPGRFLHGQDLPVQQHPGRALRHRPAPGATRRSRWRAASPGTASSSSRWSARSWPTWPPPAAPSTRSACSTRTVSR